MSKQNIFISYSHANKNIVVQVASRLKKVHNVWIDDDYLFGGKVQDVEISKGIDNATLFLPFISENYCSSKPCFKEISTAENKEKKSCQ